MQSGDSLWGLGVTRQVWEHFMIIESQNLHISQLYYSLSQFKDLNFDMTSLNAQGLRDYTKRRKVFNFMKKHTSSKGVIFMQETHSLKTYENT